MRLTIWRSRKYIGSLFNESNTIPGRVAGASCVKFDYRRPKRQTHGYSRDESRDERQHVSNLYSKKTYSQFNPDLFTRKSQNFSTVRTVQHTRADPILSPSSSFTPILPNHQISFASSIRTRNFTASLFRESTRTAGTRATQSS